MKLKSVTISNILSFPFIQDIDKEPPTITFSDGINMLVGPNGSGKSNLLEVVHIIFYRIFNQIYTINRTLLENATPLQSTIQESDRQQNQNYPIVLPRHFSFAGKNSVVRIVISADQNDIDNIEIIKKNWNVINEYYKMYCSVNNAFFQKKYEIDKIESHKNDIAFDIGINSNNGEGNIVKPNLPAQSFESFFYDYLQDFNLVQNIFEILSAKKSIGTITLNTPFSLISSLRQHSGFNPRIVLGRELAENLRQALISDMYNSTKNYSTTDNQYQFVNASVGLQLNKLMAEEKISKANEILINNPRGLLYDINRYLKSTLGLHLTLGPMNWNSFYIDLLIWDKSAQIKFEQMSSGQKSIFYLLFVIFGRNLGNGLLIIDEPELHLHTSMQAKYKQLMIELQEHSNIQIIAATHSPVFIDETTIQNIYRVYKTANESRVQKPGRIKASQKELVKLLTYTNCARIFFADKVILVEGDSDEYFYRYFLEKYFSFNFQIDQTIEIVYIGGKGQYSKWSEFLDLYKIQHYFIGDLDNIREFGISHSLGLPMEQIAKEAYEAIIKKMLADSIKVESLDGKALLDNLEQIVRKEFIMNDLEKQKLKELWAYIKIRQGVRRQYIVDYVNRPGNEIVKKKLHEGIEEKYDENIYILKQGDLEVYINTSKKDLQSVIDFCLKEFDDWVEDEKLTASSTSKLQELISIFKHIMK